MYRDSTLSSRVLLVFVICWLGFAPGVGCRKREPAKPVPLLASIESRQSQEDLAKWLEGRGFAWTTIESSDLPEGDKRPRFSIRRWQVEGFESGEMAGQAHFEFFNDRLMKIALFPADAESFTKMKEREGLEMGGSVTRNGVNIHTGRDYRSKLYISYDDAALAREMAQWIQKYANIHKLNRPGFLGMSQNLLI